MYVAIAGSFFLAGTILLVCAGKSFNRETPLLAAGLLAVGVTVNVIASVVLWLQAEKYFTKPPVVAEPAPVSCYFEEKKKGKTLYTAANCKAWTGENPPRSETTDRR